MSELEGIYQRAIYGTQQNHKDWDMSLQVANAILEYFDNLSKNIYALDRYCHHFSVKSDLFGIKLRESLISYSEKNNCDIVLSFLDLLYDYCRDNILKFNSNEKSIFLQYIDQYRKIVGFGNTLEKQKNIIYNNPDILSGLLKNIEVLVGLYIKSIDIRKAYDFNSIEIIDFTKTGASVLSNCDNLELNNSYSGRLLNGRITLASDIGNKMRQEDSILSIIKSDDCFLNVVADGAGGSLNGQKASMEIIIKLNEWFNSIDIDVLKSLDDNALMNIINRLLVNINNNIANKYRRQSYSTVVLSLTIGDRTIIANVGDSTAYAYDKGQDKLIELTTLDSCSYGMSYEDARHNPSNNMITRSIGDDVVESNDDFVHFNIINKDSNIDRIILSSDGVTDLINERRFKDYFRNKVDADDIVKDAKFTPDVTKFKTSDNISAIVIDLPYNMNKGIRRLF